MANERARELRREPTKTEYILWQHLRFKRSDGDHFRRQAPIGRYIVDFVSHRRKLIIEVDGSQHGAPEVKTYDRKRAEWLKSQGYRVLRFRNEEVLDSLDYVVSVIDGALTERGSRSSED